jgi:TolA-binding protein
MKTPPIFGSLVSLLAFSVLISCATRSAVVNNAKSEKRVRALEMELRKRQNFIDEFKERNAILEQKLVNKKSSEALSRESVAVMAPIAPIAAIATTAETREPQQQLPQQTTLRAPPQVLPPRLSRTGAEDAANAGEVVQTSEQRLYSKVLESYRVHRDLDLQKAVQILLKTYPDSVYADNALYLAGLLAFESNNLAHSSLYMDRVLREYPNGNKMVSALFAKAMIAKRNRNFVEAKALLESIRKLYPGSPEAMRAGTEEKLIELSSDTRKNWEG